jgi:hypothetical protein
MLETRFKGRTPTGLRTAVAILIVIATLILGGCGTKAVTMTGPGGQTTTETVKNIHFSNTKFLLHAGLAFGAFHRYILKPLRSGGFRAGAPHRVRTFVKAAAAAAFIVHELKIAHEDALSSNQLRPILNKIDNLEARVGGLISSLKGDSTSTTAINGASSATSALDSASGGLGLHIKDIASAI